MSPPPDLTSNADMLPSRWARAVHGDADSLRELAASYWYCVYVWWRRTGLEAEEAATATAASFTRWTGTAPPTAEDSDVGLMRGWLAARLTELSSVEWEEEGEPVIEVQLEWGEEHYAEEPEGEPAVVFDRRWTLTVLEFTMESLRAEYAARGMETLFAEAAPFVGFEGAEESQYAAAAERLDMTLGAMRRAIFDLRTQHHDLLRGIVADTVVDPADVNGEITALLLACDSPVSPEGRRAPLPTAIRSFKPDELLARAMTSVRMSSGSADKWTPPSDAEIARLFPQYETHGLVGRGGMGAVYRARQVALDREVAIKLLPLEVSVEAKFAERFVREARAMAKLSHPNIITVFDFGTTSEGHLFFVMEYVDGANLHQMIRGPGIAPTQALVLAGQVCTALAYAHGKGVIHRDIKPANVMVNTEGVAKVADFGLARLASSNAEQVGQTVTGTIMGTPEYMAPEQKRGMGVDHRADIFSMGVMLYEMICKEPPQGTFEPPSQRAGCDAGIDQIVMKAMHRAPENRYQSTAEMKADLDAAWQRQISGTPLPAAPPRHTPMKPVSKPPHAATSYVTPPRKSYAGLIGALAVVVLVIVGGIFLLNQRKEQSAQTPQDVTPLVTPEPESSPAIAKPAEVTPAVEPARENPPALADVPAAQKEVPPEPAEVPMAKPAEVPPDAPPAAAAPPTANQLIVSIDPRLQQLESVFKARFESEVQKPYLASVATLNQGYLTNWLARIRPTAQARGDLDEVTAIDAESAAIGRNEGVPESDAPGTPESLKSARAAYRTAMGKHTATRSKGAVQLYDLYIASLDGYVAELTRANKIDQARGVRSVRDEIAGKKAEVASPTAAEPAKGTTTASGAATTTSRTVIGGTVRDAARWLFGSGGKCTISKGTLEGDVLTERELPAGKFEIIGLTMDRRNQNPLPAADFQSLRPLKTLRTVYIFSSGLSDSAFDFLADNPDLTSVALHTDGLTDGVLAHLAAQRKLTELTLVYSPNFSGRGLERMRFLPVLSKVDFSSCGISDEGLKALLAAPRLRSLKLVGEGAGATDAGLAALADHRSLDELIIESCQSFSDSGFAALARLKSLRNLNVPDSRFGDAAATAFASHPAIRQLNLKGTALTDAGLARLTALRKLETINLSGTGVTVAGIEEFKRAVPKCQVTQ